MTASYNLELLYLHLQPNYNQFNYSTMAKITKEAALLYHSQGKPGKIEVVPTKPYSTQTDLSLAYSPGVAEPCLEIYNPQIQISAESETKRSIFREKDKTKRSKKESAQHSKSRNKSFVMTSVSAL